VSAEISGRLTRVRPATDDDADLIVAWHADPDVSRYWDGETFTRDEVLERLRRTDVDSYVVEAEGEPVGFIEAWREDDESLRGGLDMFLVPPARGRGLGPDAARSLAEVLVASGWTRVTADPYTWNESAIRAWRRAGFVDVETRRADDEHTSPWLLMEFQSASGSS